MPVPLSKCRRDKDVGQLLAQDLVPTVAERTFCSGIEFGDATFVIDRHDALERRVQDGCLARLAESQFLLGTFALVNVDQQVVPADDVTVRVAKRESAGLKPAVDAIETSRTYFDLEGVT